MEHSLPIAPDAPPQNITVSVIDDIPEMLFFSWQPPPPNLQNGMITEYTIICTPSGEGGPSVEYVNDVNLNATVMMFTPATQYNCTFTASTSAGPGIEAVLPVLTCKGTVLLYNLSVKLCSYFQISGSPIVYQ